MCERWYFTITSANRVMGTNKQESQSNFWWSCQLKVVLANLGLPADDQTLFDDVACPLPASVSFLHFVCVEASETSFFVVHVSEQIRSLPSFHHSTIGSRWSGTRNAFISHAESRTQTEEDDCLRGSKIVECVK